METSLMLATAGFFTISPLVFLYILDKWYSLYALPKTIDAYNEVAREINEVNRENKIGLEEIPYIRK